jgi:hypothetical protein
MANTDPIRGSDVRNDFTGKVFTEEQWNEANNLALDVDNALHFEFFDLAEIAHVKYDALIASLRNI